ncbi:MAG: hypothetical protein ACLFRL_03020 [Desulfohalobiaceae bacterium]
MQVYDQTEQNPPEIDRGYVISIVISSFKGYKDVQVHLFRPSWDAEEEEIYDWERLLSSPVSPDQPADPVGSRQVIMETFTKQEKQQVLDYLYKHYQSKLESVTARVLDFPVPIGLNPLSWVQEQGKLGKIRFDQLPNFDLDFPVQGIYDLSKHEDDTAHPDL